MTGLWRCLASAIARRALWPRGHWAPPCNYARSILNWFLIRTLFHYNQAEVLPHSTIHLGKQRIRRWHKYNYIGNGGFYCLLFSLIQWPPLIRRLKLSAASSAGMVVFSLGDTSMCCSSWYSITFTSHKANLDPENKKICDHVKHVWTFIQTYKLSYSFKVLLTACHAIHLQFDINVNTLETKAEKVQNVMSCWL
jgi:hypothetical protein